MPRIKSYPSNNCLTTSAIIIAHQCDGFYRLDTFYSVLDTYHDNDPDSTPQLLGGRNGLPRVTFPFFLQGCILLDAIQYSNLVDAMQDVSILV